MLITCMQWLANCKSQSYIKILNLLFSNPKSNGPNPNPKSKPQIPISKLKIPIKSQIPIFTQVNEHELRSVQQRRELAICQCHCQCYSIASLKCLCDSRSSLPAPVKPVNSTGETTKHWKGLMSDNQQWFGCRISSPKSNRKNIPNRIESQSLAAESYL